MIKTGNWFDWKTGSRELNNPGKVVFQKLADEVLREVENNRDNKGVSLLPKKKDMV